MSDSRIKGKLLWDSFEWLAGSLMRLTVEAREIICANGINDNNLIDYPKGWRRTQLDSQVQVQIPHSPTTAPASLTQRHVTEDWFLSICLSGHMTR